jgi:3-deoxy-D-manno-octulosonate 8-phosphate phosphatase (KDO 8-P phosphatase)
VDPGPAPPADLRKIRVVLFDVDGVLTDGRIIWGSGGLSVRGFHSRDGFGIKAMKIAGLVPGIISGGNSEATPLRAKELGIEHVAQGVGNKTRQYEALRASIPFTDEEACFIGDDVPDLGPMSRVAFPVAVADAAKEVRRRAAFVTSLRGGRGAVREVIEAILRAQGKWDAIVLAHEVGER